jgi:hexosaminidase
MPAIVPCEAELQSGLRVTLYSLPENYGKMPDFEHIAANKRMSSLVTEVSLDVAANEGRTGNYALAFDGYVDLPEDGVYDFPIQASDCARVYMDGRLVTEIMNSPAREAGQISKALGALRLAKGYHAFRIEYAEIGGGHPCLSLDGQRVFKGHL